jgi:hypothetical protein
MKVDILLEILCIVNWNDSPGYKLTKYITTELSSILKLPNTYNIRNSSNLIYNLRNRKINENAKLCSLNIENRCTNIPTTEVKSIIKEILDNGNITSEHKKHELRTLLNTIEQNHLQFNNQFYKQDEDLAIGVPISAVLAETFIQYLEHTKIIRILNKHQIVDYYKYVDDILILYNTRTHACAHTRARTHTHRRETGIPKKSELVSQFSAGVRCETAAGGRRPECLI